MEGGAYAVSRFIPSRFIPSEIDRDYEECSNIEQVARDNIQRKFRFRLLGSEKSEEIRCERIEASVFAQKYAYAME